MHAIDEQNLLKRIRGGDAVAFKTLHDLYYQPLYLLASKKLGDEDDAYDVLQELFMELWEKREQFSISNPLFNYLKNRLWFKLSGFFRKNGFREKHLAAFADFAKGQLLMDDIIDMERRELEIQYESLFSRVDAVVAQMPERMRETFSLSRSGEYSVAQIAAKMGVSTKTVNNQLNIALERVRRAIAEQGLSMMEILFLIWITKN